MRHGQASRNGSYLSCDPSVPLLSVPPQGPQGPEGIQWPRTPRSRAWTHARVFRARGLATPARCSPTPRSRNHGQPPLPLRPPPRSAATQFRQGAGLPRRNPRDSRCYTLTDTFEGADSGTQVAVSGESGRPPTGIECPHWDTLPCMALSDAPVPVPHPPPPHARAGH